MGAKRLLFGSEGRDQETIKAFAEDLEAHGGEACQITDASIDMSKAYIAGVGKYLPRADISFDPFHVIQLANKALEEVRREEARHEPLLKHSRWVWLKDRSQWTKTRAALFKSLSSVRLKTSRAWRLKDPCGSCLAAPTMPRRRESCWMPGIAGRAVTGWSPSNAWRTP